MSAFSVKNFNWRMGSFIVGYQVMFLAGLPFYLIHESPSGPLITASVVLFILSSFGVGVYHRHYSHRGYKLNPWIEPLFLFFGTAAFQGSVISWAHDHRKHHHFIDTDDDPYTVSKGFWHAHMLWLLEKTKPRELERYVPDLTKRRLLAFQHRYYLLISIIVNVILWLAVGAITGEYLGAFVLAWWGRIFVSHHVTWFINSLAHYWGERTYSKEQSAVDNYMLAFFTTGEGYHNYHHTFPADYRNGIRWYHFDPNKWLIWTLSKLGLASQLLKHGDYTIKQKLLLADEHLFLATLRTKASALKQEQERAIHELSGALQDKLLLIKHLAEERRSAFSQRKQQLSRELRELKKNIRRDWRAWHKLGRNIVDSHTARF